MLDTDAFPLLYDDMRKASSFSGTVELNSMRRGLHGQVVEAIGLRIARGGFEPGSSLPDEDTMATELNVSRTVVREAIKVLAAKGIVASRPRLGTTIRPVHDWNMLDPDVLVWQSKARPTPQFIRHLIEIRQIVEPPAAELAADRATPEDLRAIDGAIAAMAASLEDWQAFMTADVDFHVSVLTASHNPFLQPMAHAIGAALTSSRTLTSRDPNMSRASFPLHEGIRNAIRRRDGNAARDAMRMHLEYTWIRISDFLKEDERKSRKREYGNENR